MVMAGRFVLCDRFAREIEVKARKGRGRVCAPGQRSLGPEPHELMDSLTFDNRIEAACLRTQAISNFSLDGLGIVSEVERQLSISDLKSDVTAMRARFRDLITAKSLAHKSVAEKAKSSFFTFQKRNTCYERRL